MRHDVALPTSDGLGMAEERVERRLTAILAADVAGYRGLWPRTRRAPRALKALGASLSTRAFAEHRGRIVKTPGDGILAEFPSVVDAVRCARRGAARDGRHNAAVPAEPAWSSASASMSAT